jgi:hypothetical protein
MSRAPRDESRCPSAVVVRAPGRAAPRGALPRSVARSVALALGVAHAAAAAGPAVPIGFDLGASLSATRFDYAETSRAGATLNRETATLPGLGLSAARHAGRGTLRIDAIVAGGDADYDGRTQGGTPIRSSTRESLAAVAVVSSVRLDAEGRVAIGAGVGLRRWGRDIAGVGAVAGLDERYRTVEALLESTVALFRGTLGRVDLSVRMSRALWGETDVDFGAGYDAAQLPLVNASALAVSATWAVPVSPRWSLEVVPAYSRFGFAQSAGQPLTVDGQVVGEVFQPRGRMSNRTISIGWRRRFD